ncbi:MAG: DHH family phosphoesterase [Nanoarchaeota archaeon]|nr:DHH family phosphoesterase [Nanoarchaeota archaeon]
MQKEIEKKKALEALKEKIKSLTKYNEVVIVNDYDIDSCASASILWRILKKNGVNVKHITLSKGYEEIIAQKLKKMNPEKIVIVDYVPGRKFIDELSDMNITILDHHMHEEFLEKVDYYTTMDYIDLYAALSYWLYHAAKDFGIKNVEWLGRLGCFWDKCMENTEFYEKDIYKKEMEKMLPFNIMTSFSQTKGASKMVEIFDSSSSFEEAYEKVISDYDYIHAKKVFDEELQDVMFSRKAYPDIKLNIYFVKTRFKHMRVFVDYITYQSEGTQVFILNEITRFKFSFRTTLDINLVEILRKLAKKFPNFTGGGHKKACGALLFGENVEELLNEFIKEYKKAIQ